MTRGDCQNPRSEAKGHSRMTSGGYSRRDIWAGRLYAVRLAAALLRKRFSGLARTPHRRRTRTGHGSGAG